MKLLKAAIMAISLIALPAIAQPNPDANEAQQQAQQNAHIEQYVNKLCGDDAVCAEEKRAQYQERMASYKQYVNNRCGDDAACRKEMHGKYMERRAKREERIAAHCGDDDACRDDLREKYSLRMKEGREKCGQDKDCWNRFYDENKPE